MLTFATPAHAQPVEAPTAVGAPAAAPAGQVELEPAVDARIAERLTDVLVATGGLTELEVHVASGVVFLDGRARDPRFVDLAAELARNTEGVVAVVPRIEVRRPLWDLEPARQELEAVAREGMAALPAIALATGILGIGLVAAAAAGRLVRPVLARRVPSRLLREVLIRAAGVVVVLLAVYLALRVSGLTRLAVTLLGGTGLVGLILGIAFRGITENFLASVFLSVQRPFREGDLVEIAGITGYVQRLTSRSTLLTTLQGAQVQIPNATVFSSVISNHTSSPSRREDFVVGIGYDAAVPEAQALALDVLRAHPAVLDDPEPLVLVDRLGPATVDLRVYFWLDGRKHSWLKVRSSVLRLVKRALQDAGISLPDEAREVVFPGGVPVVVRVTEEVSAPPSAMRPPVTEAAATVAEGGLGSEAADLDRQTREAWLPDAEENLLADRGEETRQG